MLLFTYRIHLNATLGFNFQNMYSYVHMKPLQSMFMKGNEVTLTWQNPPLKYCYSHEISAQFEKGLDLLMLKIWGL